MKVARQGLDGQVVDRVRVAAAGRAARTPNLILRRRVGWPISGQANGLKSPFHGSSTCGPASDISGADRKRYLTLLTDGQRTTSTTLPPPSAPGLSKPSC
ncbi:MAG TPA: hypothetical protein VM347_23895 [Nonomuraea sp.]|nr:hypothetical protein [Nonomuraea sp.]